MNDQEREIKFYVGDLPALTEKLEGYGAELVRPRVLERNLRLDTSDNNLRRGGRLLRLRQDDRARVTYKDNARIEGGVMTRTEIEIEVDDFEMALKLFEALAYQVVVAYEKYRREYNLGDVLIMLDELPFGDFVEIEAPTNAQIIDVAHWLGLDWSRGIGTNYLGLMEIAKFNQGLNFDDLTFENFEGIAISPEDLQVEPADA